MITEEQVTKSIIKYLLQNRWNIYSIDFPQSGSSGIRLHPNNSSYKNKGIIIPDIIAYKEHFLLILENKNKYFKEDFLKLNNLKYKYIYSNSLDLILNKTNTTNIIIGVGLPSSFQKNCKNNVSLVDIVFLVSCDLKCSVLYNSSKSVYFVD